MPGIFLRRETSTTSTFWPSGAVDSFEALLRATHATWPMYHIRAGAAVRKATRRGTLGAFGLHEDQVEWCGLTLETEEARLLHRHAPVESPALYNGSWP